MAAWMLPQRFQEWMSQMAGPLDRRSRKYWLPVVIGVLFAQGRRTASRWFAAAGVGDDWRDHYYFPGSLGRKVSEVASELLLLAMTWIPQTHVGEYVRLAIDDSPTKRYGPHVEGAGQQQLRNVFANVAAWHLCLWAHTLVELWCWRRGGRQLRQRADRPWDDAPRRPRPTSGRCPADRLRTLRHEAIRETFSALPRRLAGASKIASLIKRLTQLAA